MKTKQLKTKAKEEPWESSKCPRCGGVGTIPTPDGKHNEVCPICGGSGEERGDIGIVKWTF